MENPIKIDDLGVPLFLETPKYGIEVRKSFLVTKVVIWRQKWAMKKGPWLGQGDLLGMKYYPVMQERIGTSSCCSHAKGKKGL